MKKLLLLSTVLLGAVTASQAGVRFNLGLGFPLPPPVVISAPAPVYVQPTLPVCAPAPVMVAPPVVVVAPPVIDFRFGQRPYWQHFRDDFHHGYYHRW